MLLVSPPDDGFDDGVSKVYGPSKRRKAIVRRRFPMGCGRNSAVTRMEYHLRPPLAVAAAVNSGNPASSKEPNGEQRPPSAQMNRQDHPITEGEGQIPTAKSKTVEHEPGDSGGATDAVGHGMEEVDPSRKGILGNPVVKKGLEEEKNSPGQSKMDSERAKHGLGRQESPALMPADDMLDGGFSELLGPTQKRRVSGTRHFPVGCGRTAAAVRRGEPGAAQDGDSDVVVGRSEESLPSLESHVKKQSEEDRGEDSRMDLQRQLRAGASLGNQEPRCLKTRKNKLPAVRHFRNDDAKVREASHGVEARQGGPGGEDDAADSISKSTSSIGSAMAAFGRTRLHAEAPLLSRGGVTEEQGKASELRAARIVMALMASTKDPWGQRRRSSSK